MITIKAPAKINLFLDVLGERQDGYHNIKSVLVPISLFDTIRIENRAGNISAVIPSVCHFRGIPWPFFMGNKEENLIVRAVRLLKTYTGCRKGAVIFLTKRIPIGAGLGGGSADAAAVLVGLNRLWKTGLAREQLMEIGAQIGCDVPALIHKGAICMEGRGEIITPVSRFIPSRAPWPGSGRPWPALPGRPESSRAGGHRRASKRDFWILLIYPGLAISTGDIYRRYNHHYKRKLGPLSESENPAGRARAPRNAGQASLSSASHDGPAATSKYPCMDLLEGSADAKLELIMSGLKHGSPSLIGEGLFNALEETVFRKYPFLEMVKKTLEKAGAKRVLLTGSGSTVFVLLKKKDEGEKMAKLIRQQIGSPLWTQVVHTIGECDPSG